YGALLFGGKMLIIPKLTARDPGRFLEIVKKEGVTVLNQTPSAFYNLAREAVANRETGIKLRYVIFGGEALKPKHLKEWKELYPRTKLINMFGITETTVHVTYKEIGDREINANLSNIGRPLPTLRTYVLDGQGKIVPIGVPGELYVGGAGVGSGYLNRVELTAERYIENPFQPGHTGSETGARLYKSGDQVKYHENGEMEYLGRLDHQVQIRGFRIEKGEIENRLLELKAVREAVVIDKKDSSENTYLCAYIVTQEEIADAQIREYLGQGLPEYMIPSYIVRLEAIPLTANGKIDRKHLPTPGIKEREDHYTAPAGETERKLAAVWAEVLEAEQHLIGRDSNFFEMGGHSLKAVNLISAIHKTLGNKPALAEIFQAPTLREMAGRIKQTVTAAYTSIPKAEKKEHYTLSSAQKRLYLMQQMNPGSIASNMPEIIELQGEPDRENLRETFRRLIERHESLRTTFERVNGEPQQKIHDRVEFDIENHNLETEPLSQREQRLENRLHDFIRPFDLARAPLLRAGVIKYTGSRSILVVDMHHIITDALSLRIFAGDFAEISKGNQLPPLRIQYKDYSEWQQELFDSGRIKKQETFWLKQYENPPAPLTLPTDFPRPEKLGTGGKSAIFEIGDVQAEAIKAIALKEEATLFMVLLAVFNISLAKLTNRTDIVTGTVIAGRRHADLERMMGAFVNVLPLRNYPTAEKTFRRYLAEVKTSTLEA
ncbi:MAG: AMP-binding protein, partial [bacterium]|nr:AMP-binding protein [bacterium]